MLDQTILKNPLLMKSANLIDGEWIAAGADAIPCLLYTSPSPRDS